MSAESVVTKFFEEIAESSLAVEIMAVWKWLQLDGNLYTNCRGGYLMRILVYSSITNLSRNQLKTLYFRLIGIMRPWGVHCLKDGCVLITDFMAGSLKKYKVKEGEDLWARAMQELSYLVLLL